MRAPRKDDGAQSRPRLSVVRRELRMRESRLGREPRRRQLAQQLEDDERGFPLDPPPLIVAGLLGRLVSR